MHVFDTAELRLLRAVERHVSVRRRIWQSVRALGALSLLAVGAVHLQQYLALYSVFPTIGTLFLLNFVGATAIGLGLLATTRRRSWRRASLSWRPSSFSAASSSSASR